MASIKTLKDSNNETIYPQTLTNAIFDLNNQSLDNLLALKIDANKTYTKDEINTIISTLSSLKFEVLQKDENGKVPDLPAVGNTDTIYLRPKENDDTDNYYDEYIYLENRTYEKIGDTKVDLSNYYNKNETDEKYAKLNLYTDNAINIGRKSGTLAGEHSIAFGKNSTASGESSLAGGHCIASGSYSVALGVDTASGAYGSFAAGQAASAKFAGQAAVGRYNIEDTSSMFIVGNGESGARSNAHTVGLDGNSWFEGTIKTGGTGYNDAPNTVITSGSVVKIWTGTQAEYDVLTDRSPAILYMITG